MDRYIVREPRAGATYPQGNQNTMMAFASNTGMSNIMPPENIYHAPCMNQNTGIPNISPSTFMEPVQINAPFYRQNMIPAQGQIVTGIDPRYLANYCDNSAQYIVTGTHLGQQTIPGASNVNPNFGVYPNDCFVGANRNKNTRSTNSNIPPISIPRNEIIEAKSSLNTHQIMQRNIVLNEQSIQNQIPAKGPARISTPTANISVEVTKKEPLNVILSKSDMLKALHKTGSRAFSGPIEKVLKWHKALQEIGVFVFYEIVAKCVSVRAGDTCSKNLVVRDENGPAMQVVYYEIDFMLPEIKTPSTIRVVGRMMPGTCRLQAFSIRPATGDDVAMLPRRAAVAAHHVAKLCKEYGTHTKN